jgi:ribosomal protein S18 acetylase RimI-like enzyme
MTLTTLPISLRWVDPRSHDDAIVQLHLEYMTWVAKKIEAAFGLTEQALYGMTTAQYVNSVKDQVCGDAPPLGTFYVVDAAGELAGMGGLRQLRPGVAEIKRIYVRPEQRGKQVGRTLLQRLLSDAQAFGFTQVVLDTAPFMQSAQRLYRSLGFVDCPAYEGTEVPAALQGSWCFMGLRF